MIITQIRLGDSMEQLYLTMAYQAAGIIYLIVGLLTVIGDKDNKNRLSFFIVCMTYAAWALYTSLMNASVEPKYMLVFFDIRRFFKLMTYPLMLLFLFRVSGIEKKYFKYKGLYLLVFAPALIGTFINMWNPMANVNAVKEIYGWSYVLDRASDLMIILIVTSYTLALIFVLLYLYLIKQDIKRERQTYLFVLLVILVSQGLVTYADVVVPTTIISTMDNWPNLPPIGSILALPQILITYYFIKKNNFLSIDVSDMISRAIDNIYDGIIVENTQREIIYCNQGLLELLERSHRDEIKGKKIEDIIAFHELDTRWGDKAKEYLTFTGKNGEDKHILIKFFKLNDRFGEYFGGTYTVKDVTDLISSIKELAQAEINLQQQVEERTRELQAEIEVRTQSEEKYKFIAYHDSMTKLLNRRSLFEKAEESLLAYPQNKHAFIFMDVNFFKSINDRYGHSEGDRLLITTADRLKEVYTENCFVARFGGDEFVVFIKNTSKEKVDSYLQKMYQRFEEDYLIKGTKNKIELSHGQAIYPDDGTNLDTLIKIADDRMYADKKIKKAETLAKSPDIRQYSRD